MEINLGTINIKKKINIGDLKTGIKKIYPTLEKLEVNPSGEKQVFKHPESYGYDEVIVNAVKSKEINFTPSSEEQIKEGLFKKVTVDGNENFKEENIRSGTTIWGKTGTMAPSWDTSQIRSCYEMFYGNTEMIEAPYLDTSNVTTMYKMFKDCKNLEIVPEYNTENLINVQSMCEGCSSLKKFPKIDTSKVTLFDDMLKNSSIEGNIEIDCSSATRLYGIFSNCRYIKKIALINTNKTTYNRSMFYNCILLTEIASLDMDSSISIGLAFSTCYELTTLGALKNLGKSYTQKTTNYSNYTLDLSDCKKLTHESLINVINGLYDLNLSYDVANGGTLYTQKLTLGATNIAKLTAEEIEIATNKRLDYKLRRESNAVF